MEVAKLVEIIRRKNCHDIYLIIILHLIFLATVGFKYIEWDVPFLQQICGFLYLTFIPGYLIIRIINSNSLEITDSILLSIGLSITTLMGIGTTLNYILPLIGITRPISLLYLVISISLLTTVLAFYVLFKDSKLAWCPQGESFLKASLLKLSPQALLLLIIPFISLFSSYWMKNNNSNTYQMLLIIILSVIIIYIAYQKTVQPSIYPIAIYVISVSLLFHSSLISNYLVEWGDLAIEYWYSNAVINAGVWDYQNYRTVNTMLSIVIIPPIYSILLGIDVLWVFKVIFPLIFSFVPVGIYQIVRRQVNDKTGFLSAVFFISMFSNYSTMLGLNRQQIGELFIIMITLTLLAFQENERIKQLLLIICFGASLIFSHYALTYIYISLLILAYVFKTLYSLTPFIQSAHLRQIIKLIPHYQTSTIPKKFMRSPLLNPNIILALLIICFAWYYYINTSAFDTLMKTASMIVPNIVSEFLDPTSVQGLEIVLQRSNQPIDYVYKFIHVTAIILIIIGLLSTLFKREEWMFNTDYFFLSIPCCLIGVASITIPYFASALNTSRLYQISLLILAPYCIIGGLTFLKRSRLLRGDSDTACNHRFMFVTLFIVLYLLFNSGFVHQIAGSPQSFSLDMDNVIRPHYSEKDIAITEQISRLDNKYRMYSDLNYAYLLQTQNGEFTPFLGSNGTIMTQIKKGDYILIGALNSKTNEIIVGDKNDPRLTFTKTTIDKSGLSEHLSHANKIVSNKGAEIYQATKDIRGR